jgi:CDP-diacylglycerol--serine O-phosphatidyltransferase
VARHVPNLLTFAGLLFGFSELGSVLNGHSELAGAFLLLALLADGLSGQLARRRKHASELGAELDSLASLIAFGVSVMVLAFERSLRQLGPLGWLISVAVAVAVALRLSRDNASSPEGKRYHGLPVPAFGLSLGLLAERTQSAQGSWVLALVALALAGLMLGPFSYARLSNRNALQLPLGLAVLLAVFFEPLRPLLLGAALLYCLAGAWVGRDGR